MNTIEKESLKIYVKIHQLDPNMEAFLLAE